MLEQDNPEGFSQSSLKELFGLPSEQLEPQLRQLAAKLKPRKLMLATAESCTGGMIAAACTDLAGSSEWFERGFVSYSNAAKTDLLGVPGMLVLLHGAVSEPVVRAMATGAVLRSQAQVSIAVTGVAGPGGGTEAKPVGTVWFGWQVEGALHSEVQHFNGDRAMVRAATMAHAIRRLNELLG
ncbi:CinA family protein [Diaphorobacter caeni]|uniref:CinA family protein n=1 Tax=Diaphorobacter caeni TaxID=2784387 RepID=UPI00188E321D|nr:CinA family protein [Diaphorobacter caeni]